jgi:GNAT superfamily N-acetyltransferase
LLIAQYLDVPSSFSLSSNGFLSGRSVGSVGFMIEIRRATADDLPGLVASSAGLFAEDAGTRDDTMNIAWPAQHGAAAYTTTMADPARVVFVADADGAIVGHLTAYVSEPSDIRPVRSATLLSMYVFPEHRSGGVGSRLVDAFKAWAAEHGAVRLTVTAYAANTDAIRFYQRNGFAPKSLELESRI